MSEVKRFFDALAGDSALKAEADQQNGVAGIASFAQSKGYNVTENDLKGVASQGKDLSEDELEKLAAGFGISIGCVICISS